MHTAQFRKEIRKGWTLSCPFCSAEVLYTKLKNWNAPTPFFYGESCNDVLIRKSDETLVGERMSQGVREIADLEKLWNDILLTAPLCPDGCKFSFWANVHCPQCRKQFPYNNGVKNVAIRINEPDIILVDGAIVIGDSVDDSWQVKVEI